MSDKKQEHWPIKLLARHSQDFMTWGCEGCNEVFPTKKEFNKHVIVDSKKPVFQNLLHQGEPE